MWQDWTSYRRFQKLPPRDRSIVFYSETHQDWHHLQPLIEFLIERLSRTVCHVTSEHVRAAARRARAGLHTFRIRPGAVCTWFFQNVKADVMVLTMLDLQNFHLKRSIHPVRYIYVFHSMGSTHMVDHANSYDHYDSLFCVGPHHVAEIRRREAPPRPHAQAPVPARLSPARAPRRVRRRCRGRRSGPTTVLLAPTWGEHSTLHVCGEPLIAALLNADIRVILRPHYQTARLAPRVVDGLVARFGADPRFGHVDRMAESDSLLESDVLISDWSAMAIEYALGLGKPVLFVDVPPRVRNPNYAELGHRAHGDAHPPRARHRAAARPRGRRPAARGRAVARRGGAPGAQRRPAEGVGVQLRPERGGGGAGDRPPRRRARRSRRARPSP